MELEPVSAFFEESTYSDASPAKQSDPDEDEIPDFETDPEIEKNIDHSIQQGKEEKSSKIGKACT